MMQRMFLNWKVLGSVGMLVITRFWVLSAEEELLGES